MPKGSHLRLRTVHHLDSADIEGALLGLGPRARAEGPWRLAPPSVELASQADREVEVGPADRALQGPEDALHVIVRTGYVHGLS